MAQRCFHFCIGACKQELELSRQHGCIYSWDAYFVWVLIPVVCLMCVCICDSPWKNQPYTEKSLRQPLPTTVEPGHVATCLKHLPSYCGHFLLSQMKCIAGCSQKHLVSKVATSDQLHCTTFNWCSSKFEVPSLSGHGDISKNTPGSTACYILSKQISVCFPLMHICRQHPQVLVAAQRLNKSSS